MEIFIFISCVHAEVCIRGLSLYSSFASIPSQGCSLQLVIYWDKPIEVFGEIKVFVCLTRNEELADDSIALFLGYMIPTSQSGSCRRGILFLHFSQEGNVVT